MTNASRSTFLDYRDGWNSGGQDEFRERRLVGVAPHGLPTSGLGAGAMKQETKVQRYFAKQRLESLVSQEAFFDGAARGISG